jgi:ABC-2 type transport system permease protein
MTESSLAGSTAPGPAAGPVATRPATAATGHAAGPAVAAQDSAGPVRAWLRFFRSELRLVFGRRRNQALLAVAAVFPIVIGAGLRLAIQPGNTGGPDGVAFIGQLAGNGIFLGFIALTLLLVLVMPLAVAVAAGDSIAGEAAYGTLRYLLAVPAGRARVLTVKYTVIVVFALAVTFGVTAVALATGAALFPIGPVTLLSGTTVPLAAGIIRLLFVALYVAAAMSSLGAIGLALSTLTEHAIGAIAALAILVVTSEVADNVPQFAAIHPYLPTHWWNAFDSLLRVPTDTGTLLRGLLSFAVYLLLFGSLAWARLTTADVTC